MPYSTPNKVLYISASIHAEVKKIAALDEVTLSELADSVLREFCVQRGRAPAPSAGAPNETSKSGPTLKQLEAKLEDELETYLRVQAKTFHRVPSPQNLAWVQVQFRHAHDMPISDELWIDSGGEIDENGLQSRARREDDRDYDVGTSGQGAPL